MSKPLCLINSISYSRLRGLHCNDQRCLEHGYRRKTAHDRTDREEEIVEAGPHYEDPPDNTNKDTRVEGKATTQPGEEIDMIL